jgi:spermine synthase
MMPSNVIRVVTETCSKLFGKLEMIKETLVVDGLLCILMDDSGIILSLRFFNGGLITLNIEYFKKESEAEKLSLSVRKS